LGTTPVAPPKTLYLEVITPGFLAEPVGFVVGIFGFVLGAPLGLTAAVVEAVGSAMGAAVGSAVGAALTVAVGGAVRVAVGAGEGESGAVTGPAGAGVSARPRTKRKAVPRASRATARTAIATKRPVRLGARGRAPVLERLVLVEAPAAKAAAAFSLMGPW